MPRCPRFLPVVTAALLAGGLASFDSIAGSPVADDAGSRVTVLDTPVARRHVQQGDRGRAAFRSGVTGTIYDRENPADVRLMTWNVQGQLINDPGATLRSRGYFRRSTPT